MASQVGLDSIYTQEHGAPWTRVFTPLLQGALDEVLGEGR